jgi:hypothetical protein
MREPKVGDKIKVKGNTSGHMYQIGKTYVLTMSNNPTYQAKDPKTGQIVGDYIPRTDFELFQATAGELKKEARELSRQLKIIKSKIAFLAESGAKTLDESKWLISHALDVLDTTKPTSRAEQVDRLGEIFKEVGLF